MARTRWRERRTRRTAAPRRATRSTASSLRSSRGESRRRHERRSVLCNKRAMQHVQCVAEARTGSALGRRHAEREALAVAAERAARATLARDRADALCGSALRGSALC